jgi:V-type H+-transporting ATPase subunit a
VRKWIIKICESIGPNYCELHKDFDKLIVECENSMLEADKVIEIANSAIKIHLTDLIKPQEGGAYSYIKVVEMIIHMELLIYTTLNMMKVGSKTYKGLAWCTKSNQEELYKLTNRLSNVKDFLPPRFKKIEAHSLTPPTATYTNEFISPFQQIVDTYGVPSYQEANPALFSIITFPFMFGIMFGDLCHGLVLTTIAAYVCLNKENLKKKNSMLSALIPARYLVLLMGIFAAFCGFIYNDFASLPLNIFHSCYVNSNDYKFAFKKENCVYPFGLDHKWYISQNELAYINSFKMKISVIFGVIQMIIGVLLKGSNAIYFKKPYDFFFEFIPQLFFLCGLFGYMILIIFIKWGISWRYIDNNAPSVISFLIDLVLNLGDPGPNPFYGDGSSQKKIAIILLIISFICIPLMLIPKPYLLKSDHESKQMSEYVNMDTEHESSIIKELKKKKENVQKALDTSILKDKEEKFDFGEIFVHQLIECIEFVLGTISNTASYLRLWALSLAHAQLSKVFFDKILAGPIKSGNSIGVPS